MNVANRTLVVYCMWRFVFHAFIFLYANYYDRQETDSSGPNADEFEEDTASTSSCDPNQPEEFSFAVKSGGFPSLMGMRKAVIVYTLHIELAETMLFF